MGAKVITDDLAQELYRKYCDGIMLKDLEKQYGISRSTIGSAFARRGLKRGKVSPQKPKQEAIDNNCPPGCSEDDRRNRNALRLYSVQRERVQRMRSGSGM